jgi:hypothetical protein
MPRKLDFSAVRIPSGLSEEQKKLWKERKCIWCHEPYTFEHRLKCKRRARMNEVDVEEDVNNNNNKNIGEYGSFLFHHTNQSRHTYYTNVSQVRRPEIAKKDEMVESQLYDKKAK